MIISRRSGAPRRKMKQGFTLAEMIMAIAMLAIFSVFIVQMYVKADQLTRKARCLDQAVACASDLADLWKAAGTADVPEAILRLRQEREAGRSEIIYLDQAFKPCANGAAVYQAVLTLQPGSPALTEGTEDTAGLWRLSLVIGYARPTDSGPIYALQTARYFPEEVGAP
jgi:prepilin-type N-terminal cleavage/methylation domain-containing protein